MNTPANGPVRPSATRNPIAGYTETPAPENGLQAGMQRLGINDLTSDQLDALYERIATLWARLERAHLENTTLHRQMDDLRSELADARSDRDLYARALNRAHALAQQWTGDKTLMHRYTAADDLATVLQLHGWEQTDAEPRPVLRAVPTPLQLNPGPTEAPQSGPVVSSAPRSTPDGVSDPAPRHEPSHGRTTAPGRCDGCGHIKHPPRQCPLTEYGQRCACGEPIPMQCAHCQREIQNRAEPSMGWPARDHWVHVPGAYEPCHPERGADSPRAEPKTTRPEEQQ